jgi:small-conductance mechanosensitive channel
MRQRVEGSIDLVVWGELLVSGAWLLGAILLGLLLHTVLFWLLGRLARRTPTRWDEKALERTRNPSRLLFPLFVINLVVPHLVLPPRALALFDHTTTLLFIASVAYLLVGLVLLLKDFLLSRHDIEVADNLAARKVHTQIKVLEKVLISVVAVATVAFMLMTFEGVRQVGVSILASAGIAGIILGLAAQRSIGTLLAGIQIAITQPIRVDDVVIVEGEWGWIEEITLTYVVVRIWDLRRLVIPITHFIEHPFQNWTRVSADILGTVLLYTDYTIPVDEVRQELHRIVEESELWDGRVCGLQVTDCRPDVLELRLLISAEDSGKAWNLRCHLREKMVAFIQEKYPESLPRVRAELGGAGVARDLGSSEAR